MPVCKRALFPKMKQSSWDSLVRINMMLTAWIWGFVLGEKCSMLSPEQAHNVQLGHRYELCPGAKSMVGSGPDIQSLMWAGSGQFCWDPKH